MALRREVEALRVAREARPEPIATPESTDTGEVELASIQVDVDWTEVKALANEVAEEVGRLARQRPVVGIVGAFLLGIVVGRLAAR